MRENICDTIKCLLFLFKSVLTKNLQCILLLWSNACGVNFIIFRYKSMYTGLCVGAHHDEIARAIWRWRHDDVTWTSYSLKPPVIWLFDYQLMWTHIKETWKYALLALGEGNSPVTDEVPTKEPAAANAQKLPFEDVIMAWFEFVIKWGTYTIICFSIYITPSNISSL